MKPIVFLLAIVLMLCEEVEAQTPSLSPQQWSQISSLGDEFNSFDPAKWKNNGSYINVTRSDFYINPKSYGSGTNNIRLGVPTGSASGSAIFLKLKKEAAPLTEGSIFPINYTGAQIQSVAKFEYGYYEIRAKLPQTTYNVGGTFWLYSQKCPQDYNPGDRYLEVDVFEMCSKDPSVYPLNLHTHKCNACWKYNLLDNTESFKDYVTLSGKNFETEYHIMGWDWQPDYMDWYVDNELIYHIDNNSLAANLKINGDCNSSTDPRPSSIAEMTIPMCVFFDAAISNSYTSSDASLPPVEGREYEIDYFRYYKKSPQIGISTVNLSSNTTTINASAISGDVISWIIGGSTSYGNTHNFNLTINTDYHLSQLVKASQTIVQSGQSYVAPIIVESQTNVFLSYGGQGVSLNTNSSNEETLVYISDEINSSLNFGTSKNVIMRSKGDIYFTDGFGIELGSMLSAEVNITQ